MTDKHDYSLLGHNTFGIDARCKRFLEFSSLEEAKAVAELLRRDSQPFMVIGAGSNLLLTADYEGTVVHSTIRGISLTEEGDRSVLRCGSGETWDEVVAWTVQMGYADLANLSLIPGEVGAAAVQNIGAYGAEACQVMEQIQAVDIQTGELVSIPAAECGYGYRKSNFKQQWKGRYLITHVTMNLRRNAPMNLNYGSIKAEMEKRGIDHPTPQQLREVIIDIRRAKLPDPKEQGNAGSFFMNPVVSRAKYEELASRYPDMPHYYVNEEQEKIPAGWMIEQCGWKGKRLGKAGVHDRQALVLVNNGGATGNDVLALCRAIQKDVERTFGVGLQPEVNIL